MDIQAPPRRPPHISSTLFSTSGTMLPPDPAWECGPRRRKGLARKAPCCPRPL